MHDERGLLECGVWTVSPGTEFGPYAWLHGIHSLFWILDGSATVIAEGRSTELRPYSVYCAPPEIEHHVIWDPRHSTRFGWANFRPEDEGAIPRVRHLLADDIVITLLHHLLDLSTQRPEGWTESAGRAFDYILHAYRTGHLWTRSGLEGAYSDLVTRAIVAMQTRWRDGVLAMPSLLELAAELGVSERHLCRAFDVELGLGPITVFRMVRIAKAAQMLTDTRRTIRQISEMAGFADPYHFARVFKATIGVPPGAYRAQPPEETQLPPQIVEITTWLRWERRDESVR